MNNHINGLTIGFFVAVSIIYLLSDCESTFMGRPVWPCPYGENRLQNLYVTESSGTWTSQSLFDAYSCTHISHGILLFYILYVVHGYQTWDHMIYIALAYEILWELLENSPMIIERYRAASTISRNYAGDSIINSVGDVLSMSVGFIGTWYFPQHGYKVFLVNELLLYYFIRDNLLTNVYQIFFKTLT